MTAAELADATKEFDGGPDPVAVPPTPKELAKHKLAVRRRSKGQRGRPRLGAGAARVLFTLDPNLLMRLDVFARKHGLKRSNLIAQSVEAYMRMRSHGIGRPIPRNGAKRAAG